MLKSIQKEKCVRKRTNQMTVSGKRDCAVEKWKEANSVQEGIMLVEMERVREDGDVKVSEVDGRDAGIEDLHEELLHPCMRDRRGCRFKEKCAWAFYPKETCLFHLKFQWNLSKKDCYHGERCRDLHIDQSDIDKNTYYNSGLVVEKKKEFTRQSPEISKEPEEVSRLKGLLNKLAVDTFDVIYGEICTNCLYHQSDRILIADIIFEKAVKESLYASLYSQLILKISESDKNFKKSFIQRCRKSFLKRQSPPPIPDNISKEEEIELLVIGTKIKEKNEGMMNLLGELYNQEFLSHEIIGFCFQKLVEDSSNLDSLHNLCILISTSGQKFNSTHHTHLSQHLSHLSTLTKNTTLPKRTRFHLMNTIDQIHTKNTQKPIPAHHTPKQEKKR